jgi:hypothetical protein
MYCSPHTKKPLLSVTNFNENLFRFTVGLVLLYVYFYYVTLFHKWNEILVHSG